MPQWELASCVLREPTPDRPTCAIPLSAGYITSLFFHFQNGPRTPQTRSPPRRRPRARSRPATTLAEPQPTTRSCPAMPKVRKEGRRARYCGRCRGRVVPLDQGPSLSAAQCPVLTLYHFVSIIGTMFGCSDKQRGQILQVRARGR